MDIHMPRMLVVGTTCSGKTTFARRLSGQVGVPHIELDALYWLPEWRPRPPEEFYALVEDAIAGDGWVVDGNYSAVRDLVWPRATMVVWLNYSLPRVLSRGLRRTARRALTREVLYSNNTESFAQAFLSRDSILWWLLTTYHRRRRRYRTIFDSDVYPHLAKVECRGPSQAEEFLRQIAREKSDSFETRTLIDADRR
jgi:adenylate kinase family enzyme